uniref:Uncharacterized protein n=1 Tax=Cryptococcus bacillisporus CA1280 TaxID=1296109 RepID=A0A0D0VPM5_CRYGA|nr:hypothetical protein I312_01304 [Cryptococcus bacillisporus CA1280]
MSAREPPQKAKISTSPALRGISIDGLSRRSVGSQQDLNNSSDIHRSVLLSPTASIKSWPGPRLSHRSSEAYIYSQREDAYHQRSQPPRLRTHIHPHTHPMSTEYDLEFHSADRLGHGSRLSYGLRLSPVKGPSGGTVDNSTSSQASMVSTGNALSSIKSPRKRVTFLVVPKSSSGGQS